jgi:hypothetical protein
MDGEVVFYICPKCFDITETPPDRHGHQGKLVECHPGEMGDARRKPPVDEHGHVMTRAPRWYLEAIGMIKPN